MKILSILLDNCRESDRSIGIKLKMSGGTVKSRREKMQDAGIIQQYVLKVEPPLFGFGVLYVVVTGQDTDNILQQCKLVGKPYLMVPCVGGVTVCGVVVKGDEIEQKIDLAKTLMKDVRILSIFEAQSTSNTSSNTSSHNKLTRTDFEILKKLITSPRQKTHTMAKDTALSVKTISRCRDKLYDNSDIQFTLTYDPKKLYEYIPFAILVWTKHESTDDIVKINEKFSQYYLQIPFLAKNQVVLFMYCKTIFEMDEITQQIRDIDIVSQTDLFIPKKIFMYNEWLYDIINEKTKSSRLHVK